MPRYWEREYKNHHANYYDLLSTARLLVGWANAPDERGRYPKKPRIPQVFIDSLNADIAKAERGKKD